MLFDRQRSPAQRQQQHFTSEARADPMYELTSEADSSPDELIMPASNKFAKLRIRSNVPLISGPPQRSTSSLKRHCVDEPFERECDVSEPPREDEVRRNSYGSPHYKYYTSRHEADSPSDDSPMPASPIFTRLMKWVATKRLEPFTPETNSPPPTNDSKTFIYEPEIPGYLNDTAVAFFPDNQSAHDIVSYDYAKRNHLKINSSTKGRLQTAKGSHVNTLGTVSRTVRFSGEPEEYIREFHVLPKCVHDIILGSPFLRLTQTFTKFRHRIVKKLRGMSPRHRVCLTGSAQEMLSGWANGQSILALPDTGSDICLMSLRYARERGHRVDTDPKHLQMLEFVDGSTAETSGRVEGFQWEFDRSDIQLHTPEIHVLEGLQTDLLLGYEFLEDSDAFGTHEELFIDAEPHDEPVDEMFGWLVSTIKLVTNSKLWGYGRQLVQTLGLKSRTRSDPEPSDLQQWHDRKPHELTTYEKSCTAARALSEPYRTSALQEARDIWNRFWAQRPGCGNDSDCSARMSCGSAGCDYIPPDTSTIEPSPTATGAAPIHDQHPPDLTAAGAEAVPDPGPTLSVPAQTPNTTGTNASSIVDPPGIATNPVLQGAATAPQSGPKPTSDRLTVWQMTSGLVRMFAKSGNKMLITIALLFLLMLHFAGKKSL